MEEFLSEEEMIVSNESQIFSNESDLMFDLNDANNQFANVEHELIGANDAILCVTTEHNTTTADVSTTPLETTHQTTHDMALIGDTNNAVIMATETTLNDDNTDVAQQLMTTTVVKSEVEDTETTEAVEEAIVDQFSVEAIVGKRKRNNRFEYCVKWLGFADSENTWEPIDNLNCSELIADFESKQVKPVSGRRGRKPKAVLEAEAAAAAQSTSVATTSRRQTATTVADSRDGFARGLKPKRVIGVTETEGQLFYTIEWVGLKEAELVLGRIARVNCPQLVIAFLQSKLTFNRKRPREPLENYRPLASKKFSIFNKN